MTTQSNPPQLQLDPQTQAFFENFLNQQLQQQEQHFLQAIQWHEEEIGTKRLDMMAKLQQAGLQSKNTNIDQDIPMNPPVTMHPNSSDTHHRAVASSPDCHAPTPRSRSSHKQTTATPTPPSLRTLCSSKQKPASSTTSTTAASTHPSASPKPSTPLITKEKKGARKPAAHIHHLLAAEVPADIRGVQAALKLHIRLLWGLFDPKQPPTTPEDETLQMFNTCFQVKPSLMQA